MNQPCFIFSLMACDMCLIDVSFFLFLQGNALVLVLHCGGSILVTPASKLIGLTVKP